MTTLTHTLLGVVLAKISVDTGMIPATSQLIYPFSIIAANAPDFDVLYTPLANNHRESLLHTPLFWLVIIGISYIVGAFYPMILPYIHILTIGVVSHFLLDTACMRSGIRWFYPFNKKFFNVLHAVTDMHLEDKKIFIKTYMTHPVMLIESAIVCALIFVYVKL